MSLYKRVMHFKKWFGNFGHPVDIPLDQQLQSDKPEISIGL